MRQLTILLTAAAALLVLPVRAQNGINVRDAKVYDNRSLTIMLEQLNQQLVNITVVDPQKLAAALGSANGSSSQDAATTFQITRAPNANGTAPAGTGGTAAGGTGSSASATPAPAPSVPTVPDLQAAPTYSPTYSQNVQDLLTEQINLTYRIFDLRMLLERSLTDRLDTNGKTRLQAVVGLNLTLDPPENSRDQAAYVEMTIRPKAGNKPSLVGQMPESKTYNTSALSTKSTAFGGSAVTKMFTVSYNQRRRSQVFYLYQDSDTIALDEIHVPARRKGPIREVPDAPSSSGEASANEIVFGWEFRPVLGRRSVAPGPRELFAILSLDGIDGTPLDAKELEVSVRTYWRRYQRATLTTRATDIHSQAIRELPPLKVLPPLLYELFLSPDIGEIRWQPISDANAVLTILGKNFFTGTKVIIGDTTHDSTASGLIVKSDNTLELRAPLKELTAGRGYLSGRYGPPQPLQKPPKTGSGIAITTFSFPINNRDNGSIDLVLQDRVGGDLTELPGPLMISAGDTVLTGPFEIARVTCNAKKLNGDGSIVERLGAACLRVHFTASLAALRKDTLLTVQIPFLGDTWKQTINIYPAWSVTGVIVLGGSPDVTLVVTGSGFGDKWQVLMDKVYLAADKSLTITDNQLRFEVKEDILAKYKQVVVQPPNKEPALVLALPGATPPSPKPAVKDNQTFQAVKSTAATITITGTDLDAIKAVKFGDTTLPSQANKDGGLTIVLNRDVTKEIGVVTIQLVKPDGSFILVPITITAQ